MGLPALVLVALSAHAQPKESVRLEYRAAETCPSEQAFQREVRARTQKAVFSRSGTGRTFRVRLEPSEPAFTGTLELIDETGQASERRIEGAACGEVASALALVVALAIDPEASTAPVAERAQPRRPAPRPRAPVSPRSAPARLAISAGLAIGAIRGPAPETLIAAGPSIDFARQSLGWRPSMRLSILAAQTGIVGPSAELATFRFGALRSELCPHAIGISETFTLRGCMTIDFGLLYAHGDAAPVPGSATRAWFSAGLGIGLEAALSRQVSLGFSLAESANGTRDEFVFEDPRVPVHPIPVATQSALVAALFRVL